VERRPDVDQGALQAMLRPLLGHELTVARTPAGVAAQVYRVHAAGRVVYARIAEDDDEDLSVDAALLEHLRALGLHVPEVVHVERFEQALGRSVLITGEIAGEPLAGCRDQRAARRVARAAGRELAVLNGVGVQGFGWVRRQLPAWPLRATSGTYAEFVTSYLPDPWPGPLGALFSVAELELLGALVDSERRRNLAGATLSHGDFDTTAIFQHDGGYSGLIDFGEIRGTEPLFDLGHFHLCGSTSGCRCRCGMPCWPATARSLRSRQDTSSWLADRQSCWGCGSSPGGWGRPATCDPAIPR
jgi:aminoglycoside phosphotransferase (APT) family kinase protein